MNNLILKSFIPEIFISISLLLQLLYNTRKVTFNLNKSSLLTKEIFFQLYFILFLSLILLSNINIEGIFSNFLFLNDCASNKIKIILLVSIFFFLSFI
jgi:hypothetical protein